MVYVATFPAVTVVPKGVAESEKSAKKIVKATVAVCWPEVPVTVRFSGLALEGVSPLTVRLLACPAVIVEGLNAQVTLLPPQLSVMPWPNDVGAVAATLKFVEVVPIATTLDRVLAERLKAAAPFPDSDTDVVGLAALEVTRID